MPEAKVPQRRLDAIRGEAKSAENRYRDRRSFVDFAKLDELGIKMYKAREKDNFLAIIPPKDPNVFFGCKVFVHRGIGPNDDSYLCPAKHQNLHCPVCDERKRLQEAGEDEAVIRSFGCYPPRFLYFVVDMSSRETMELGPQLYDAASSINEQILSLSKNKRTGEVIDVSDPVEGCTVVFTRKGLTKTTTRYISFELEKREPLREEWLDVPDFSEVLVQTSPEELAAALHGPTTTEDEKVEREPRQRRRESEKPEDDRPARRLNLVNKDGPGPQEETAGEYANERLRRTLERLRTGGEAPKEGEREGREIDPAGPKRDGNARREPADDGDRGATRRPAEPEPARRKAVADAADERPDRESRRRKSDDDSPF